MGKIQKMGFYGEKKSLFLKYLHAMFSYENSNINDTTKILDFRNKENILPNQCTLSWIMFISSETQ